MFENWARDLRAAWLKLGKQPLFTLTVVVTLGLGIGANTAIFSVVNGVLLRPLAYRDAQQLYVIHEIVPQWTKFAPQLDANLPDYLIWQKEARSFDGIAIAEGTSMIVTGDGEPEELRGTRASANFLELLGVRPALGRWFQPEEDQTGHGQVVILTDTFWRSRFQADPGVIGHSITLDGIPHTIVGVLPQSFHFSGGVNGFGSRTQFLTPLNGPKRYERDLIGEFAFTAIARLRPGVTPQAAVAELNVIQSRIAKEAEAKLDLRAEVAPLQSEVVGSASRGLILLLVATGAVLLMICVNVANLLLARVPGRMREAAIRKALGASPSRLVQQLLAESLLLAFLGGAIGAAIAAIGVRWIAHAGPVEIPRLSEVGLDARALGFVILTCVITALLFGALPAWLIARADFHGSMGAGTKSATEGRGTRRMRSALVAFEVAACTTLLVIAGLLGRSLWNLLQLDPGFAVEHVLAADVDLPPLAYQTAESRADFYGRALDGIRRLPEVEAAAWVSLLPLEGQGSVTGINLPGHRLPPEQAPIANYRAVSPDYFRTMGIPIMAGRSLDDHDRGKRRVILSQGLAQKLLPNQDPVGQPCLAEWGELQLQPSDVVGVAGDIRTRLDQLPLPMVYVADSWGEAAPGAPSFASIVVRTKGDPVKLASAVRKIIRQAGPDVPIVALRPMTQLVALNVESRRFQMSLAAAFAISALLLAALGIFGVIAYSVEQRQREFGIRIAFGARHAHLLRILMQQGLSPVVLGIAAGTLASLLSGTMLSSLVFGVRSSDPLTVGGVVLLILVVACVACFVPARHAMAVDPMQSLRCE